MKYLIYAFLVIMFLVLYLSASKYRLHVKAVVMSVIFVFLLLPQPVKLGGVVLSSRFYIIILAGIEAVDEILIVFKKRRNINRK